MGNSRVLRARFAGSCSSCGAAIARGDRAWWDAEARKIWCLGCHGEDAATGGTDVAAAPPIDVGEAGRSAQAKYERLHARREEHIEQTWGRFAGVVKFFSSDPQSTVNWQRGAAGERRVAAHLQQVIGDRAIFLHDRRIPRSTANIDLLVVAASGVWIVDAKQWTGKVEQRNVGGWFTTDLRLYVGGRDRSRTVDGLGRQMLAVNEALGDPGVPVVPALCFVGAEWGWFAKPFKFRDVWVSWAQCLAEMILEPGPLDPTAIERTAATLAARLRAM